MSTVIWALAGAGLGSVLGGWAHYISTIPRDTVPRKPVVMFITQPAGLILGGLSLVSAADPHGDTPPNSRPAGPDIRQPLRNAACSFYARIT